MKRGKNLGLNQILALIKAGKKPSQISKIYKIPKQTLQYNVDKLKELGCIEKKGYGVWGFIKEVPKRPKDTFNPKIGTKEIRGHAFIWKIDFFGFGYNWREIIKKYKSKLKRPKLSFQYLANGKVPRTIFKNRKIWLTKSGMIIYEPISFIGRSSFEVKGNAVYEMDQLVKGVFRELRIKFRVYRFTTSREHYAQMKNELARQYNDKGKRMNIRDEYGTIWLWIDNSEVEGYRPGELETKEAKTSRNVQTFWNSQRKHNFKVDADYIEENLKESAIQIKANADNLNYHAENMRSHVKATKDLSNATNKLNENLEKQTALFEKIADILSNK